MDIRCTVDTVQLEAWATLAEKRLPQGMAWAINTTIDRVRPEKLYPWIESHVHVRTPQTSAFLFGAPGSPGGAAGKFPRAARATASRLWAEFGTGSMERHRWFGGGGPVLLPGLVTGAMREPQIGAHVVAVPLEGRPARPSIRGPVPPAMRIANLRLRMYVAGKRVPNRSSGGHARGVGIFGEYGRMLDPGRMIAYRLHYGATSVPTPAGAQWKGLQRTFQLPHTRHAPLGGIFQRFGPGRAGIRLVYAFVRPFPLPRVLADYERVVIAAVPSIFRQQAEAALQTAVAWEQASADRALAREILRAAA